MQLRRSVVLLLLLGWAASAHANEQVEAVCTAVVDSLPVKPFSDCGASCFEGPCGCDTALVEVFAKCVQGLDVRLQANDAGSVAASVKCAAEGCTCFGLDETIATGGELLNAGYIQLGNLDSLDMSGAPWVGFNFVQNAAETNLTAYYTGWTPEGLCSIASAPDLQHAQEIFDSISALGKELDLDDNICIEAAAIPSRYNNMLVHQPSIMANVLCLPDSDIPCGTRHHALSVDGEWSSYGELCSKTSCVTKRVPVNAVLHHHWHVPQYQIAGRKVELLMGDVRVAPVLYRAAHYALAAWQFVSESLVKNMAVTVES